MKKTLFAASHLVAILFVALAAAMPLRAEEGRAGDLVIGHAYAYASIGQAPNGAAFMTIANEGEADALVGVESDLARRNELHTHIREDDRVMMRPVERIEVPAHGEATLKPGGDHVMLIGLNAPLKAGTTVAMTLIFEKAGRVPIEVVVEKRMPGGHGAMKHGMKTD